MAEAPRGRRAIGEALISRHNQRFENVPAVAYAQTDELIGTLHLVRPLDQYLTRAGVNLDVHPPYPYGTWLDHLRWGLDSACCSLRQLLMGNVLGAAAVARTQLERWSEHLAESRGAERLEGESTAEFYTRLWKFPEELEASYVALWGDTDVHGRHAGDTWTELSEVLHGRGQLLAGVHWETSAVADPRRLEDHRESSLAVHHAVQLSMRHIKHCVASHARSHGMPDQFAAHLASFPDELPSTVDVLLHPTLLWPMNMGYLESFTPGIAEASDQYLAELTDGSESTYSERALEAFASRRGRAARFAVISMREEARLLGDDFDPAGLAERENAYIFINEIAGLLSAWQTGPVSDALATAASALRSAFWLWLEDDDRAMVLARTVLEQTARIRTWRLKPAKAQILEDRAAVTRARDWLQEAGWRRLSVLNRSLGEYSHASMRARWGGAYRALIELQAPPEEGQSDAAYTARGGTLNRVAFALAIEVREQVGMIAPDLSSILAELLPVGDDADTEIEGWLERCWAARGFSFGEPDVRASEPRRPEPT